MWVFTKAGFLSAVKHDDKPRTMRVRARRWKDLEAAFPDHVDTIIDHAETDGKFDYRWHLDVSRDEWVGFLVDMGSDVDYTSHAKEAMSGDDKQFYATLLKVWEAMYVLQDGPSGDDVQNLFDRYGTDGEVDVLDLVDQLDDEGEFDDEGFWQPRDREGGFFNSPGTY